MGRRRNSKRSEQQQQPAPQQAAPAAPTRARRSSRAAPTTSADEGASVQRAEQLGHRVGVTFSVGSDTVVQAMRSDEIQTGQWYRYTDAEADPDGEVGVERVGLLVQIDEQGYHFMNGRADSAADVLASAPGPSATTAATPATGDGGDGLTDADRAILDASIARANAAAQAPNTDAWFGFLDEAQETSGLSPKDASTAKGMIRKMNMLSSLGEHLPSAIGTMPIFERGERDENAAIGSLAPTLASLIRRTINIKVNGLESSDYKKWDFAIMADYLRQPLALFDATFGEVDSNLRLELMMKLTAGEWNIEKYIMLMQEVAVAHVMKLADPGSRLKFIAGSSPTSAGGDGEALVMTVFDRLFTDFLRTKYSRLDIANFDVYESRESFEAWLQAEGYTVALVHEAVMFAARGTAGMQPITLERVAELWEYYLKKQAYADEYDSSEDY